MSKRISPLKSQKMTQKVKEFLARHPVDLQDKKFVASENFKKEYKNAFGSEFNI